MGRAKHTSRQPGAGLAGLNAGNERFFAAVLENVAQPICVVDADGRVQFANPAALAALGCGTADDQSMRLPPATGEAAQSDLDWFVRCDGSTFPVSYFSVPIETPAGPLAVVSFVVATAISNIEARTELAASRARIVQAADEERRRLVRDLHDGAQQRLVHTILTLKLGLRSLAKAGEVDVRAVLAQALDDAQAAIEDLRELAHGILPGVLTHGGLSAAVNELASRMPVPVESRVSADRFPAAIEATAYFVVAEALTNIAKHSRARHATVAASVEHGTLRVRVRDDGVGGARPQGTGLLGMADRLAALGGQLRIESPADGGTLIAADFPLRGLTPIPETHWG